MSLVLFGHLLGSALWIGGALAAMVIAMASKDEDARVRVGVYRLLARVHTMVIGVGAVLVLTTGVLLTMWLSEAGAADLLREPRLWVMLLTGGAGGLLVLFLGLPTAVRMGGLAVVDDDGNVSPAFEMHRKRQALISSIAGVLAIVALLAWKIL